MLFLHERKKKKKKKKRIDKNSNDNLVNAERFYQEFRKINMKNS